MTLRFLGFSLERGKRLFQWCDLCRCASAVLGLLDYLDAVGL